MESKKTRRSKKKSKKQLTTTKGGSTASFDHPRQISGYGITHRKRMRFLVGAAITAQVITYSNLIDTIGFVWSATGGYNVFRSVKVNFIEMWDTSALGAASSLGFLFAENDANESGTQQMITDISLGVIPAHLKASPSKQSLTSKWHAGFGPNNTTAFTLWASASCIIDVDLSFVASATGAVNGTANALVGANVGAIFYRGLDGLAVATTKFICPIGVYQL